MDIPSARLAQLNSGQDASSNLAEGLAVDFAVLMAAAVPPVGAAALEKIRQAAGWGVSKRMVLAGEVVLDAVGRQELTALAGHASDTVRGWVCYALAHDYERHAAAKPLEPAAMQQPSKPQNQLPVPRPDCLRRLARY